MDIIHKKFDTNYIQYDQSYPGLGNYCTIIAAITAISNTVKREVSEEDIKRCANAIGRTEWSWWLPWVTVRRVTEWRNANYPEQVTYKQIKTEDCYMRCDKGKFAVVWFRFNDELKQDLFSDCTLNAIPKQKTTWGHAVTLCKWLTIIDNYENSRICNIWKVASKEVLIWAFQLTGYLIEKI